MLSLSQSVFLTDIEPAGAVDRLLQLVPNRLGQHLTGIGIDLVGNSLAGILTNQAGHFSATRTGQAESLLNLGGAFHEPLGPALECADRIGHTICIRLGQARFLTGNHSPPVPRSSAGLGLGQWD
jgi:hypothetical protein